MHLLKNLSIVLLSVVSGWAATLQVGPTRAYKTPCAAISVAVAGDSVEIDAPATFSGANAPCRIVVPMKITGVGGQVTLNARDAANVAWNVYSQGIWSIQTTGLVEIANVDFVGASVSVADGNNASGIRLVTGSLTCTNCGFFFNQDGMLTGADTTTVVRLIGCHFAFNGYGDGYTHNLYMGPGAELYVERSVLRNSNGGQDLKSRAAKTSVLYSVLGEAVGVAGGNSQVELDVPNGGVISVIGNLILQSAGTVNGYISNIGVEGITKTTNSISWLHNTVVGYRGINYFFRFAAGTTPAFPGPIAFFNNLVVGPGTEWNTSSLPTTQGGNSVIPTVAAALFVSPTDYRLQPTSPAFAAGVPVTGNGFDTTLIPSQALIPFGEEARTDWSSAGAFSAAASLSKAVPTLTYAAPAAPTVFSKVAANGVPIVVAPPTTGSLTMQSITIKYSDGTSETFTFGATVTRQ